MWTRNRLMATSAAAIVSGFVFAALVGPVQAQAFTFGAAGDFANGTRYQETINAVGQNKVDFFLALGDTSYSSGVESSWCSKFKTVNNNFLIVAGNHDVGESSGADINKIVQYCPFTLSGLNGNYGRRYYFDYPSSSPIARVIMASPGLKGTFSSDNTYTVGGAAYNYVASAIDDARAKGIKWVIVGMHKNYISPLEKSNEVGTDFMNLMFNKKVDLVLQGHEHGYARTKQLKCAKTGSYDAACVADADNNYVKGQGLVINILGTGGQGLRGLNTGDSEYQYFASANNTAYGFGRFEVTDTNIKYNFVRSAGGTLVDSYTLAQSGTSSPTPAPTPSPTPTPKPTTATSPTPTPGTCSTINNQVGTASFNLQVATAGTYKMWSRLISAGDASNSYWIQIDNACPVKIGDASSMPTNAWTWVDYRDGNTGTKATVSLTAGSHAIKLIGSEAGVKLDRILFVMDQACVPVEVGENCFTLTPTPSPTTSPTPKPTVTPTPVPTIGSTPTPAPTASPTPVPTSVPGTTATVRKSVIADTHVRSDRPNTNYGSTTELESDGSPHKIAYLKFDLQDLVRREIVSAKLRVYVTDSSSSTQNVMSVTNPNWIEEKLTWNTRHARGSKLGTISNGKSGTWKEVEIGSAVSGAQGSLFSVAIEQSGSNGLDFKSSESSSNKPELVITYR